MNHDEAARMCGWGGCTRTKGHPADDRESEGSHADEWPPEWSTVEEGSAGDGSQIIGPTPVLLVMIGRHGELIFGRPLRPPSWTRHGLTAYQRERIRRWLRTGPHAVDLATADAMTGCPYYRGVGTCNQGCYQEPECQTNEPTGGWRSQVTAGYAGV